MAATIAPIMIHVRQNPRRLSPLHHADATAGSPPASQLIEELREALGVHVLATQDFAHTGVLREHYQLVCQFADCGVQPFPQIYTDLHGSCRLDVSRLMRGNTLRNSRPTGVLVVCEIPLHLENDCCGWYRVWSGFLLGPLRNLELSLFPRPKSVDDLGEVDNEKEHLLGFC